MRASAKALLGGGAGSDRCVTVSSYLEAVGVLVAHKAGVNPACLTADVTTVREMSPMSSDRNGGLRETLSSQGSQALAG